MLGASLSSRIVGDLKIALILFSALSFVVYGAGCFTSQYLAQEFERYGFARLRRWIGVLQLCGSMALITGLWFPVMGTVGAGGLTLMMLTAIAVRIRIRDSLVQTLPAILYFLINAWLALRAY